MSASTVAMVRPVGSGSLKATIASNIISNVLPVSGKPSNCPARPPVQVFKSATMPSKPGWSYVIAVTQILSPAFNATIASCASWKEPTLIMTSAVPVTEPSASVITYSVTPPVPATSSVSEAGPTEPSAHVSLPPPSTAGVTSHGGQASEGQSAVTEISV